MYNFYQNFFNLTTHVEAGFGSITVDADELVEKIDVGGTFDSSDLEGVVAGVKVEKIEVGGDEVLGSLVFDENPVNEVLEPPEKIDGGEVVVTTVLTSPVDLFPNVNVLAAPLVEPNEKALFAASETFSEVDPKLIADVCLGASFLPGSENVKEVVSELLTSTLGSSFFSSTLGGSLTGIVLGGGSDMEKLAVTIGALDIGFCSTFDGCGCGDGF